MIDPDETLVRITAPHFTAGIVVKADVVIVVPPILKYMRSWSSNRVRSYVRDRGWTATVVKEPNHPALLDVLGKSPYQGARTNG